MHMTPEHYRRIVTAKLYIDANYREPIQLDDISRNALLSRFHFHRLFSSVYKMSPHKYLTRKRLHTARELLADKELSVADVCNQVGFESIGSFSLLFKRETGIGPQHYRNMLFMREQQAKKQPRAFIPHCFIEGYKMGQ